MPQFDVSKYTSLIFWFFVCFIYLIYYIKKKFIPKMENVLQERYFKMDKERQKIEVLKQDIDNIHKKNEERLQKAHQDVEAIVQKAKNDIAHDREDKLKRFQIERAERIAEFDHELKGQMQEIKDQFEKNLDPYLISLKDKIVPKD